ncbi:MAG: crossover junction endodeoxyribonuclease RuvC [Candidatus Moranbacteria bacterium]|jgi:crossover junction endodeoxyribonuclease RuvC|nr:crossover junction endodeoxyribonuclease RuvC [Candidatus Moranbacteria bacterium]
MRILGIDPGTATTGWAILEQNKKELTPIAYGHISTSPKDSTCQRLREVSQDIEEIIKKYKPTESAIEDLFFFKNLKTAMKVSQSRGAIMLTLIKADLKVFEYTPLQVKQAVTGYGRADKKQVQQMVKNILKLKEIPTPDDTADAIAIAICHMQSRNFGLARESSDKN